MAVKTITIDLEAYEILVKARKSNESFSQVTKNVLSPETKTARNLLKRLSEIELSEETLDRIDDVIERREENYPVPRTLDGE